MSCSRAKAVVRSITDAASILRLIFLVMSAPLMSSGRLSKARSQKLGPIQTFTSAQKKHIVQCCHNWSDGIGRLDWEA
jgi:hypothetical protein